MESAFEAARHVEGVALSSLPKVSLHDHLDGGLRPRTVVELATRHGIPLPAEDPEDLARWVAARADSGSLEGYLQTFDLTVGVMQTAEALTRVAREAVEDLAADGVIHAELRWAPEQHLTVGLFPDESVEAVQAGLDQGVQKARDEGRSISARQLVSGLRQSGRVHDMGVLAVRHLGTGVAGFDIAGPERGFPPALFERTFDYLLENGVPVTIHAGEADGVASIRSAIVHGHALRLGHGVRIAEDISIEPGDADHPRETLGVLARWVRDRQIPLELSPSSNLQTGAIAQWGTQLSRHPFDRLARHGFTVTVNTDNRLMSATSLTRECGLLASTFGYGLGDLLRFQLNAARGAFLSLPERLDLLAAVTAGFGLPATRPTDPRPGG